MKKKYSLKGHTLFKKVFEKGRRVNGRGFWIQILKWDDELNEFLSTRGSINKEKILIGLTISRKFGTAPERNKAKRRIRSIFQSILKDLNGKYCIVLRPNNRFKEQSFEDSKKWIIQSLKKAGIFNEED